MFHAAIAADGPVMAVQEALKREQFYFGALNGELDEPTRTALRRFQIRHGLSATGEIDTATMQTLQGNEAAARPTLEAQPSASKAPKADDTIAQKDRHFLQKIETGLEPLPADRATPPPGLPAPAPIATGSVAPPTPQEIPVASAPPPLAPLEVAAPAEFVEPPTESIPPPNTKPSKPAVAKNRPTSPPNQARRREVERAPPGMSPPPARNAEPDPIASVPPRRVEPQKPAPAVAAAESEPDPDPLGSHGVRIIRSRSVGSDGRVYITERRITNVAPSTPIPVRRAERVEPRKDNIFRRIFNDDGDDD